MFDSIFRQAKNLFRKRPQAETHPKETIQRLALARKRYELYKQENGRSNQEEAVFEFALLNQITKPNSATNDYFESALESLKQFQSKQLELRQRPEKEVIFVDCNNWRSNWISERRLTILFRPRIEHNQHSASVEEEWPYDFHNRLGAVSKYSEFEIDWSAYPKKEIDHIEIWGRSEPYQSRGSSVRISESSDAEQLTS